MRWLGKIPEGVLDPQRQLGEDGQSLVEAGEIAELRRRLLAWQRVVGKPEDKVRGKLLAAVRGQLTTRGMPGSSYEVGRATKALEQTRAELAETLIPIRRAYLLSTRFVLKHYWMLSGFGEADWVNVFLGKARAYGKEHDVEVSTSFQPPIRSIGSFGWTGSANLRCEGTAGELQQFVQEVCKWAFVGMEPGSLKGAFMEEIATYAEARAAGGFVVLTDAQLFPETPGSESAERRKRSEELQQTMDHLREMTARISRRAAAGKTTRN